jgi:hypothetical protein
LADGRTREGGSLAGGELESEPGRRALRGGCLCGGVRFQINAPLLSAGYCHCGRCQRRTGAAASAQARIAPGALQLLCGQELLGSYEPGEGWAKIFCRECGSALFSRPPGEAEIIAVRLGTFDGDPGIRPEYRQRVESAACWEPLPDDGLPRLEGPHPDHASRCEAAEDGPGS